MVPVSGVDEVPYFFRRKAEGVSVVAFLSTERLTIAWNWFKSALPRSADMNRISSFVKSTDSRMKATAIPT